MGDAPRSEEQSVEPRPGRSSPSLRPHPRAGALHDVSTGCREEPLCGHAVHVFFQLRLGVNDLGFRKGSCACPSFFRRAVLLHAWMCAHPAPGGDSFRGDSGPSPSAPLLLAALSDLSKRVLRRLVVGAEHLLCGLSGTGPQRLFWIASAVSVSFVFCAAEPLEELVGSAGTMGTRSRTNLSYSSSTAPRHAHQITCVQSWLP